MRPKDEDEARRKFEALLAAFELGGEEAVLAIEDRPAFHCEGRVPAPSWSHTSPAYMPPCGHRGRDVVPFADGTAVAWLCEACRARARKRLASAKAWRP